LLRSFWDVRSLIDKNYAFRPLPSKNSLREIATCADLSPN